MDKDWLMFAVFATFCVVLLLVSAVSQLQKRQDAVENRLNDCRCASEHAEGSP